MNFKAVTLRDIAVKLNYSTVTISKALRGHPDIAPKTVEIIRKTAEEMGYTPNLMARNLSSRKSNTIGVVVPKIAHFFFGAIIERIYSVALKSNYEIILTVSQESAEIEKRHIQTLMSMKVDGLLVSITQETKNYEIFDLVMKRGFPLVFMDRVPELNNISSVMVKDREGAFNAVEYAIKLGYRNIAHFAGYQDINIGQARYRGFEDAMKKYEIPINPDWVTVGGFGEKYGYEALMKLYKQKNIPDLIFTVTYPVALGVYIAARELGLRIPEDIDVICFGNAKVQSYLSPPLSCVDQPTDLIAEESMGLIIKKIEDGENSPNQKIELPTNLIIRGTCKEFNKSK